MSKKQLIGEIITSTSGMGNLGAALFAAAKEQAENLGVNAEAANRPATPEVEIDSTLQPWERSLERAREAA